MELCTILQTVTWQPKNEGHLQMPHTLLGLFVEHLVTKNIGMLRNAPPPGVSGNHKPLPPVMPNSKDRNRFSLSNNQRSDKQGWSS